MTTLLTGATGYLGAYLTQSLLARGEEVWALVRARDAGHALERAWEALQLHLSAPALREALATGQLRLVLGDVRSPGLGLAPALLEELLGGERGLIHAAATLNRRSSKACFDTNLRGGLEVIQLARRLHEAGRLRRFAQVSTVAVAGVRRAELVGEDQAISWERSDWDPYARTKKFAEHLLQTLLPDAPTLVFRPSIILGDSRFPETTQFDMVQAFVRLAQLPLLPFDPQARLDIVPADFVAEALVDVYLSAAPRHAVYHLSAGAASPTFRQVTDALAAQLGRRWRPRYLPRLGPPTGSTMRLLADLGSGPARHLAALLQVFWPYLEWDVVFDNRRIAEETGRVPRPFPEICGGLFRFALDCGFRYPFRPLPPLLREPAGAAARPRRLPVAGRG